MLIAIAISAWLQTQEPKAADLTREQIIKQDIDKALEKLSGDDYWEAALARNELMYLGREAVKPLIERFHANAGKGATPADEEKRIRVRYWVCELLGDLRDASDDTVSILVRSLEDRANFGTAKVCAAAAISLSKIGSDKAIEPLFKALEGPTAKTDRLFKAELIVALGNLRAKQAEAALRQAFKSDDGKTLEEDFEAQRARIVSAVAAEALGRIRAKDSVADLAKRIDASVTDPLTGDPLWKFIVRALQRIQPDLAAKSEEEVRKWAEELKKTTEAAERAKENAEKRAKTKEAMAKIEEAIRKYKAKENKNPATLDQLKPDHLAEIPNDGWGKPFRYGSTGTGGAEFDVVSDSDPDSPAGIWNHDKWLEDAKKKTDETIKRTADAVQKFNTDQKRFPFSLIQLIDKPPEARNFPPGGYLPGLKYPVKDAWGGDIEYEPSRDGKSFTLRSFGRDRKKGGEGFDADVEFKSADEKK